MQVSVLGIDGCPHVAAAAQAARAQYPQAVVVTYLYPKDNWDVFHAAQRSAAERHLVADERQRAAEWKTSPAVWVAEKTAAVRITFVGGAADMQRLATTI